MQDLIETLGPPGRLALAYAPRASREATLALLALDARLARIVRTASEPMLAQVRIAWWRDMLSREPGDRPGGEPLLAILRSWEGQASALVPLTDGWERLVGAEPLRREDVDGFCEGRALSFGALAGVVGCPHASADAALVARRWALADLAAHLSAEHDAGALPDPAGQDWAPVPLPRALRPLFVLDRLAANAGRHGGKRSTTGMGGLLIAMRAGLFGR